MRWSRCAKTHSSCRVLLDFHHKALACICSLHQQRNVWNLMDSIWELPSVKCRSMSRILGHTKRETSMHSPYCRHGYEQCHSNAMKAPLSSGMEVLHSSGWLQARTTLSFKVQKKLCTSAATRKSLDGATASVGWLDKVLNSSRGFATNVLELFADLQKAIKTR